MSGYVRNLAVAARQAQRVIAACSGAQRSALLEDMATQLLEGHASILSANASVDAPFSVAGQRLGYRASVNAQAAPNAIPATEMLSIGNRYSVRGFDGSRTLVGQSGWVLRNEVALAIGNTGQEAYAAADAGAVGRSVTRELAGRTLVGAALGVRGAYGKVGYDVSVGMPVAKPAGFEAARVTVAVQLSMRL